MALTCRSLLALPKPFVAVCFATCSSLPFMATGSSATGLNEHQAPAAAMPATLGSPILLATSASSSNPVGAASFLAHANDGSKSAVSAKETVVATQQHVQEKPVEAANITMKYNGIDPDSLVHHNGKTMTSDWRKEVPGYKGDDASDGGKGKSASALQRPTMTTIGSVAIMMTILGHI